jgi:hypothetical protein
MRLALAETSRDYKRVVYAKTVNIEKDHEYIQRPLIKYGVPYGVTITLTSSPFLGGRGGFASAFDVDWIKTQRRMGNQNMWWFAWEARTQISNSDVQREERQGAEQREE